MAATFVAPATPSAAARSTSAKWKPAPTSWSTPPNRSKKASKSVAQSNATLYVSSDAKDTDFTIKADRCVSRRHSLQSGRNHPARPLSQGYDKPLALMEKDKVYKLALQPMTTSNFFPAGHRIRIEMSSSNFPRFDRNLNTGGNNYDESTGIVAHNTVHHSKIYPSQLTVTVVKH